MNTNCAKSPYPYLSKYDIDSAQMYPQCFEPNEPIFVTEKIHGCNSRYVWAKDIDTGEYRMHCGSHSQWKMEHDENLWWKVLSKYPGLREWCQNHPDMIVYGEVYGQVQKGFHYGGDDNRFVVFDIFDAVKNQYFNPQEARDLAPTLSWVPCLGVHPFNLEELVKLSKGKSLMPDTDHIREGIVISPLVEKWHDKIGRVKLKIVNEDYLTNKKYGQEL
jgi:RNA ligase (TIGR02306 family)